MAHQTDCERWQEEARFFDAEASKRNETIIPIDTRVVERYQSPGFLYPKEYSCRILGDLHGKTVLDVGCGEGENTLLLAKLGAKVTGIDISPKAIELGAARAKASGLSASTRFLCAPIEAANLPDAHFDVIFGDNILHHVLPVLDETMRALLRAAKPGGNVLFIEPTNLNPTLRRIRFLVPVHTEQTPGERPLERDDLDVVRRHVPDLTKRHFVFLGRLNRFLLPDGNYENAPAFRRALVNTLAAVDFAALTIAGVETLGGMTVLHGHVPFAKASRQRVEPPLRAAG
jgi:2-polyprenyl-3-methyl-5-hydroxy-6-metoxy-1,4-benzoquinol methylase